MKQNSYNKDNGLYLIPTPIGNLDDISKRIIDTLNMVDVIACEDTRVTGKLLTYLHINKPLIVNQKFNEDHSFNKISELLKQGKNVGLVSDAGMPCISDPGNTIAYQTLNLGYKVVPVCGPNAALTALMASGLDTTDFRFIGFLDSSTTARISQLENLKNEKETLIFYESVHRIDKTLKDILTVFGDRNCCVAREISKLYETFYYGTISSILEEIDIKGEYVIIVAGNKQEVDNGAQVDELMNLLLKENISLKSAVKIVSNYLNVNKNSLYKKYLNNTKE